VDFLPDTVFELLDYVTLKKRSNDSQRDSQRVNANIRLFLIHGRSLGIPLLPGQWRVVPHSWQLVIKHHAIEKEQSKSQMVLTTIFLFIIKCAEVGTDDLHVLTHIYSHNSVRQ